MGVLELFVVAPDGGRVSHKLNPPLVEHGMVGAVRFAPDSQHVVFAADAVTEDVVELYSAPVDGSAPAVRLHGTPVEGGDAGDASVFVEPFLISASGQRVVFPADLEVNGRHELYRAPLDGSMPAVRLSGPLLADRDVSVTAGDDVVYRAVAAFIPKELFRVPLLGGIPPERLHPALPFGRDVTGFALDGTGTRVLYRVDLEADERYELYLVNPEPSCCWSR